MAHSSDLIAENIDEYLHQHQHKELLRFIACGSVDDGKSTLIGRLLYESQLVFDDHLAALEADSKKVGTQGGDLDFALLLDGLSAEREQGITIDVAYRFFSTETRKFIVADTPGHEQYTRNMITGASTADVAVILVDARKGLLTQTRRHSYLVSLIGVRTVVLAVNKMDLIGYDKAAFDRIEAEYREFAAQLGITDITCIPLSALKGDNITEPSPHTPWYTGPTFMRYLETVPVEDLAHTEPMRMPVQWVNRPDLDFRGFSGIVVSGIVRPGMRIKALPSGTESTVARIVTMDGDLDEAQANQAVTLTLTDEIDVSRGDVICDAADGMMVADRFEAHIVWMHEDAMQPGRPYLVKLGARTVSATIAKPTHRVDVNTLEHPPADTLHLNEIGLCGVVFDRPVAFDTYAHNRDTGGFIVIDRMTNTTVGAGIIERATRTAQNVHWHATDVDAASRGRMKGHGAALVWFTGLSGAGKSTVANLVERRLHALGVHTFLLDGDNVRHGLNQDLGFSDAGRVENIRRVAEVGALMVDAGLVVLASFISPFAADREMARHRVADGRFVEVFVDAPLTVAEGRDPKGLYAKARAGEIAHFTGIDSPYEPPDAPEVHVRTDRASAEDGAEAVVAALRARGILPGA